MALPTRDTFLAELESIDCPICYNPITGPVKTSCSHIFCHDCATKWFRTSNTCPSCRAELYQGGGGVQSSARIGRAPPPGLYSPQVHAAMMASQRRQRRNAAVVLGAEPFTSGPRISAMPGMRFDMDEETQERMAQRRIDLDRIAADPMARRHRDFAVETGAARDRDDLSVSQLTEHLQELSRRRREAMSEANRDLQVPGSTHASVFIRHHDEEQSPAIFPRMRVGDVPAHPSLQFRPPGLPPLPSFIPADEVVDFRNPFTHPHPHTAAHSGGPMETGAPGTNTDSHPPMPIRPRVSTGRVAAPRVRPRESTGPAPTRRLPMPPRRSEEMRRWEIRNPGRPIPQAPRQPRTPSLASSAGAAVRDEQQITFPGLYEGTDGDSQQA